MLKSLMVECRRSESNRHGHEARRILSPLRLPVSPLRHWLLIIINRNRLSIKLPGIPIKKLFFSTHILLKKSLLSMAFPIQPIYLIPSLFAYRMASALSLRLSESQMHSIYSPQFPSGSRRTMAQVKLQRSISCWANVVSTLRLDAKKRYFPLKGFFDCISFQSILRLYLCRCA